jgi:putative ABC transport system permease protein
MFLQNLRHAVRLLRKNLGVTSVALLTLTIGIGASTAIFSVVYAVLLKPLPYDRPDEIVRLWEVNATGHHVNFADPNFEDIRSESRSLAGVAEFRAWLESVSGGAEPVRVTIAPVSRDFFSILRVQPVLGRGFRPEDHQFGAAPVVLVGHSFWKQFLGGARDLSEIKLTILNHSASVVGVLPPGFDFPENAEIWFPRETLERLPSRTAHNWQVVARLRDRVTIAQAHAEFAPLAEQIHRQNLPDIDMTDVAVAQLQDELASPVRPALVVLLAAVGFLLLVACLNVANLLLVQTAARQKELAIRIALGAKRPQILNQFLLEALLLSLSGGALGVVSARTALIALLRLAPPDLAIVRGISINLPVLAFALAMMVTIAVGLGLFSAYRAVGKGLQGALTETRSSELAVSPGHYNVGGLLVVGQLAITLVLLTGAGLLGRSLFEVLSIEPGFRTERVVAMDLALSFVDKPQDKVRRIAFLNDLFSGLRAIPGVSDVGGTDAPPLAPGGMADGTYVVLEPGQPAPRNLDEVVKLFHSSPNTGYANYSVSSEGFFSTLGIPLSNGRLFDDRDTIDAPHVALISESLAHEKWPQQDPLGRSIEFGNMDGDLRPLTVVGVVGDIRSSTLEKPPQPTIYVNYRQRPQATSRFVAVIRSTQEPASLMATARTLVERLDPTVPPDFTTFNAVVSRSLHSRQFNLALVGFFAISALLLAIVGLYGVMAYRVARRTGEIGVRIALGATRTSIFGLVLAEGVRVTAVGVIVGILGSVALTRTIRSLLFGLSPLDPLTFLAVALLLIAVALVACYIPARRAARVDPMVALRYE